MNNQYLGDIENINTIYGISAVKIPQYIDWKCR